MTGTKLFAAFALCCFCSLLLPPVVWPQDFSSIDKDLEQLENLIADTFLNSEAQQKLLEDLKQNLSESGELIDSYENTITEQEKLLKDLQARLNEMSEIYRTQSFLSAKYARSSKFWKIFTLIAIPAAAALSAGITIGISK